MAGKSLVTCFGPLTQEVSQRSASPSLAGSPSPIWFPSRESLGLLPNPSSFQQVLVLLSTSPKKVPSTKTTRPQLFFFFVWGGGGRVCFFWGVGKLKGTSPI